MFTLDKVHMHKECYSPKTQYHCYVGFFVRNITHSLSIYIIFTVHYSNIWVLKVILIIAIYHLVVWLLYVNFLDKWTMDMERYCKQFGIPRVRLQCNVRGLVTYLYYAVNNVCFSLLPAYFTVYSELLQGALN